MSAPSPASPASAGPVQEAAASQFPAVTHHGVAPPLDTFDHMTSLEKQQELARETDEESTPAQRKRRLSEIARQTSRTSNRRSREIPRDVEKGIAVPASPVGRPRGQTVTVQTPEYTDGAPMLRRITSQPPVVCPNGSVAPADDDGFRALRSLEDAEAREARRLQRTRTVGSRSMRSMNAVGEETSSNDDTVVGADPGKEGKTEEDYMVRWDPGEKANPKNWSVNYRWFITACASLLVLNSTFASSAPSGVVPQMIVYFGFSSEVATLTISLFVAGYCVGPLLWGPMSESYGRKPIFIIAFFAYTGFQIGCALAKNTASILVFRFLGGLFAACPLTNAGALLADIWDADRRGIAMALFSLAPFAGPALGPIVGGFIGTSGTSWRWIFWVLAMFAGFCFALIVFIIPETYGPKILVQKAKRIRKETGDDAYWAPLEHAEHALKDRIKDILIKPAKIFFLEPILQAITVYMSFVYGCIYLLFEAFPIVFTEGHGFSAGITGTMFLGVFIGGALATATYIIVFNPRYTKIAHANAPNPTPPEARLEFQLYCAPLFAIAFFIFGFTSYPSLSWVGPCIGGGVLGFATLGIFVSSFNFMIDVYLWAAASALAANTVLRSLCGAGFPLFATQMYNALNPRFASLVLACIAVLLAPIPFLFRRYGAKLRARSKFAPAIDLKK